MTGEIEDARAALDYLRGRYPDLPFALAGFSFGSRAIMKLGCEIGHGASSCWPPDFPRAWARGIFWRNAPFRRSSSTARTTNSGRASISSGSIRGVAEPKRLIWIEAADHFFAGALEELEERVLAAAESAISGDAG